MKILVKVVDSIFSIPDFQSRFIMHTDNFHVAA